MTVLGIQQGPNASLLQCIAQCLPHYVQHVPRITYIISLWAVLFYGYFMAICYRKCALQG